MLSESILDEKLTFDCHCWWKFFADVLMKIAVLIRYVRELAPCALFAAAGIFTFKKATFYTE